jgi:CheY-like chemotaxis protein
VPRIMIADDNTNIQKMVVLAFEERGIDVVAVGNGEAAVRRLADANPDLILADVFMPVRNGYEVCEFVKKDSRFSHVPVILLVGAFDPLDEKEARRVGADGVLKKPFVPPDPLIAMVMSALEKNPKIAAELAKAREVPVDPPPPPMPALEIPAKAEPKPLPEFPEPTPEEAAAIYGFGKGVRSLDDEDVAAGKEPKAPVMDEEEEPAEDFDGAATTNDWRRKSGMDIQIPENVASEPSFSYGRDVSPALFPSEHDVPPKRIHVSDEIVEQEAVARDAASPISNAPKQETPSVDDFFHPAARPQPEAIPAQQQVQAPAASQQADAEFTPPPRVRSWMDMMAPLPSEHPATNASVTQPTAEIAQPQASSAAPVAEPESISPAPAIFEHRPAPKDFEEYPPKKKSWFTDAVEAVREAVHSVVQEGGNEAHQVDASDSTDAIQQDIHEPAHEPAPQPVSSAASISSNDLIADHVAATPSRKDPALEEPPAAHVTAEPLLVRDEPSAPSGYGIRTEDTSPAHSFLPAPAEAQFEEDASSNGGHSFFEPPPQEPAPRVSEPADYGERIPTAPPPNREALAEIPFLMPPTAHKDSGKVDQDTVDAVVARVLEKLEPQLHDLLSKGVLKPLIENMLQGELAKKEK